MDKLFTAEIETALVQAVDSLLDCAGLKPGHIFVLGASTSEVAGSHIGSASSQEIGDLIIKTVYEKLQPHGIALAVGCCEHLNRAIVLPRETAERYRLTIVYARPVQHAGGACGTAYFNLLPDPVLVETVEAYAGMDIGDTLIGMHLRRVAVPVRCPVKSIGRANLVLARTRPKYIGGPRTQYLAD